MTVQISNYFHLGEVFLSNQHTNIDDIANQSFHLNNKIHKLYLFTTGCKKAILRTFFFILNNTATFLKIISKSHSSLWNSNIMSLLHRG